MNETQPTPEMILAFLDGSAAIDGVWYGERHPDHTGLYWWRPAFLPILRASLHLLGEESGSAQVDKAPYLQGQSVDKAAEMQGSAYLAAPSSSISASEWRPIDTAPTDGTHVLVYWPRCAIDENDEPTGEITGHTIATSFMNGGCWVEPDYLDAIGAHFGDEEEYAPDPTLWMPLPAAPAIDRVTGEKSHG